MCNCLSLAHWRWSLLSPPHHCLALHVVTSYNPPTTEGLRFPDVSLGSLSLPELSLMLYATSRHTQLCLVHGYGDTHFPDPGSLSVLVSDVHMLRSYVSL